MTEDSVRSERESDAFEDLVGADVAPLKKTLAGRVALGSVKESTESLAARRAAAEAEAKAAEDPLSGEPAVAIDPYDLLAFKRPGVQDGVYRNLRLGKYALDARLDLHKMTVDNARREVYQFVRDCVAHDVRSALITHGTGVGRAQPAILKSYIAFWLPQLDDVLAFHTAQKHHGSYGSTYVLMRKSAQKRLDNRERHSRR